MSDSGLLAAAFSMLETAVAVSRRGKIVYMNPAAVGLAGGDLTSKPVDMLMPSHISNNQADSFVTTALIGEKSCTVKVSSANGYRIHVKAATVSLHRPATAFLTRCARACRT